jgi:hypothetical protein
MGCSGCLCSLSSPDFLLAVCVQEILGLKVANDWESVTTVFTTAAADATVFLKILSW